MLLMPSKVKSGAGIASGPFQVWRAVLPLEGRWKRYGFNPSRRASRWLLPGRTVPSSRSAGVLTGADTPLRVAADVADELAETAMEPPADAMPGISA
jgi:hypothetical protein